MKRNVDADVEDRLFAKVRYFESATACAQAELEKLAVCLMQAWLAMHDKQKTLRDAAEIAEIMRGLRHCLAAYGYLSGPSGADSVSVARAVERLRAVVGVNERRRT